nr:MAG TPA: hypothetical protein [Caudoviricetes sp.]
MLFSKHVSLFWGFFGLKIGDRLSKQTIYPPFDN